MYYHELKTQTQSDLIIIKIITNSLSILGTCSLILVYLLCKELRSFSLELVLNLAIADLLQSIGNLVLVDTVGTKSSELICQLQALLIQWFSLSSVCWTTVIAYALYVSVIHISPDSIHKMRSRMNRFRMYAYLVPGTVAMLLVIVGRMGVSDFYQCWIGLPPVIKGQTNYQDHKTGSLLGIIVFYIPLGVAISYNSFCFYKVVKVLRSNTNTHNNTIIKRLKFYPLILVLCWTFGCIYRISLFSDQKNNALLLLHVFFSSIQGFFNSLVYGFQKPVREVVQQKCCNMLPCFYKKQKKSKTKNQDHQYEQTNLESIEQQQGEKQQSQDKNIYDKIEIEFKQNN